MAPRPVRRKPLVSNLEIVSSGEIVLQNGRGSFTFPCNSRKLGLFLKLKSVDDPNEYPNCLNPNCLISEFFDEIRKAKVPGGYEIIYRIDSTSRILGWTLAASN